MDKRYEKLLKCRDYVRTQTQLKPRVALVLGSGLGRLCGEAGRRVRGALFPHPRLSRLHRTRPRGQADLRPRGGRAGGLYAGPRTLLRGLQRGRRGAPCAAHEPAGRGGPLPNQRLRRRQPRLRRRRADADNRPHPLLLPQPAHRGEHRRAGRTFPGYVAHLRPGPLRDHTLRGAPEGHTPARGRLLPADRPRATKARPRYVCSARWARTPWACPPPARRSRPTTAVCASAASAASPTRRRASRPRRSATRRCRRPADRVAPLFTKLVWDSILAMGGRD